MGRSRLITVLCMTLLNNTGYPRKSCRSIIPLSPTVVDRQGACRNCGPLPDEHGEPPFCSPGYRQ